MAKFSITNKLLKQVAVSIFLSVFALVGTAAADDCVVPKATTSVGDASVESDTFEAIRSGVGDWGQGRTYASAAPTVEVGLSEVAATDFAAVRDIVAGNARPSDAADAPRPATAVSIGLVEIDRDDFLSVRNGLGKYPSKNSRGCA